MLRNKHQCLGIILMVVDSAISVLSIVVAGILRFGSISAYSNKTEIVGLIMITLFSSIVVFIFVKMFARFFIRGKLDEILHVFSYTTMLSLFIALYAFSTKNQMMLSRLTLLYFFILDLVLIFAVHLLIKKARALYIGGISGEKLLIITDRENVEVTCRNIHNSLWMDSAIGVIMIDHQTVEPDQLYGIPLILSDMECIDYVQHNAIDEVLVSISEDRYHTSETQAIINNIAKTGAIVSIRGWLSINEAFPVVRFKGFRDFYVISFANREYDFLSIIIKRTMDIIGGLVGSLITVVIGLILAPVILIESPGPLFFKQKRVGRNGRVFTLLKFRSMCKDAETQKAGLMAKNKMKGPLFKIDDDSRITKVGKFIRKTSLDEFPQFFNILKGDMSLVGTRPPTLDEYKQYTCAQKRRLSFRPGLTGIWQTSGRNDIIDFDSVLQMDLEYIQNWSLYLDVKLLLKTVWVVAFRRGAV